MNFSCLSKYITFLFAICCFYSLCAQNNQLRAYTIEDGLPQSQVYDIVQDEIGYLWLGTQGGGLCSFDGSKFKVWNERDGLFSNYIHSLAVANDSLFIGTRNGLSVKTKKGFENLETPQINKIIRVSGHTYLATNLGIYLYDKGKVKKLRIHPEINISSINDIAFDGKLFWVASNKGLWKTNTLKNKPTKIEKLESNNFFSVAVFQNKIFAATFNDGTLVYNKDHTSSYELLREPLRINSISLLNNDELWIATYNDGITVIDAGNYAVLQKLDKRRGLKVSHIRKTIKDRQGNIWIATSGGGFYKYFQNNFKHYDRETGLKGNRVYAVHKAKDGIWLSNSEAGLVKIDSLGIHPVADDDRFSEVKIKTITSDLEGNIWAGTDGRGILIREERMRDSILVDSTDIFNVKRDTISEKVVKNHLIDTDKGLPSDWVRTIQITDGQVWVASYSSGIVRFSYDMESENLSNLKYFGKKDGIEDILVRDMKIDVKGRVWYTTANGHLGYIENQKVNHLGNLLDQKVAIGTLLFKDEKLFVGTAGNGIWWSDLKEPIQFQKLNGNKRTYSDNIYQLIFDDKDNLWAGTERGVDKIILNQSNNIVDVFHFGRNDGFLGIETCLNAVTKDEKGNLWFGAIYGLTKYQPGDIDETSAKLKLHFETVEVAYKPVDSINIKAWTNSDKVLQLKPSQTQLTFTYRSIDIDHPGDIQYRFKLNDNDWSPWSSEIKQNFSDLQYGNYQFTTQSRNIRWEESDPISFKFFIESPLYKKTWFQWLMILAAIVLIGLIALFYVRRIRKRNKEERERLQMQNHLLSLEQKALRLQMNPHFIFNVLNGIKAMGANDPQKMNTTINTFATLLRETLYNSRQDHISLDQEAKTLKNYIEVEQLMTTKVFSYTINIDLDIDPEEVLVPPMLIQPFVENAIRHGIMSVQRDGDLQVNFKANDEFLLCEVIDNGIGIYQSQKAKTKSNHQSVALDVTKERIESLSGKGSLSIDELKNKEKDVIGTRVYFKIPLLTDY